MKPDTHTHTQHTRTSLHARTHTHAVLGWLLILCIPLLLLFEQVVTEMLKQRHLFCVCACACACACARVYVSARARAFEYRAAPRQVRVCTDVCTHLFVQVRRVVAECVSLGPLRGARLFLLLPVGVILPWGSGCVGGCGCVSASP